MSVPGTYITSWYRQVHTGMYLEHAYTYVVEVHTWYILVHSTAFSIHTFEVKAYDSMYSAMKAITPRRNGMYQVQTCVY